MPSSTLSDSGNSITKSGLFSGVGPRQFPCFVEEFSSREAAFAFDIKRCARQLFAMKHVLLPESEPLTENEHLRHDAFEALPDDEQVDYIARTFVAKGFSRWMPNTAIENLFLGIKRYADKQGQPIQDILASVVALEDSYLQISPQQSSERLGVIHGFLTGDLGEHALAYSPNQNRPTLDNYRHQIGWSAPDSETWAQAQVDEDQQLVQLLQNELPQILQAVMAPTESGMALSTG